MLRRARKIGRAFPLFFYNFLPKCYQEANSDLEKAEDLGLKAIQEYIENHALSGTDAEMYELKLKSKGLENSSYR